MLKNIKHLKKSTPSLRNPRLLPALLLGMTLGMGSAGMAFADGELDQIKTLVNDGKMADAYQLAQQLRDSMEGDPAFDLYYGIAAMDSGHTSEGIFALERVLLKQPSNDRARLELARGYFSLREDDRARKEFKTVLAKNPPKNVQENIQRFLDAIRLREGRYRTTATGYAEFGAGYDSNANAAPGDGQVLLFGTPFQLSASNLEQSDAFVFINLGSKVTHPVAPGLAVYGQVDVSNRPYDDGVFDISVINLQGGATFLDGKVRYRVGAQAQKFYVDYEENRDMLAINADVGYKLSEMTQLTGFAQAGKLFYPGQSVRNATTFTLGFGGSHAYAVKYKPLAFGSVYVTKDNADKNNGKHIAERRVLGLRLGTQLSLAPKFSMMGSILAQNARYGAISIASGVTRDDDFYVASISGTYLLNKDWVLKGEVSRASNDSNIDLNQYTRTQYTLSARYEFK